MNILLVVNKPETALQYYRQLMPHNGMVSDACKVDRVHSIHAIPEAELGSYDIVQFIRYIDTTGRSKEIADMVKKAGCKLVVDIDDYWVLPSWHGLYKTYREHNAARHITESLELADLVTTTTEHFRQVIKREINHKNIEVLPNCIDTKHPQFTKRKIESGRLRFGWIGGVHHHRDIEAIENNFERFWSNKELVDKAQLCLGGFNINLLSEGNIQELAAKGLDENILRNGSFPEVWSYLLRAGANMTVPEYIQLEKIFTRNYKGLRYEEYYLQYLREFTKYAEHIGYDKPYRRIWGRDTFNYADLYNEIDVALIPLYVCAFNRCKSELKLIEAGIMGKAVICSDVMPYSHILTEDNSMRAYDNHTGFFSGMRKLLESKDLRDQIAGGLSETIARDFDFNTIQTKRKQIYKCLITP